MSGFLSACSLAIYGPTGSGEVSRCRLPARASERLKKLGALRLQFFRRRYGPRTSGFASVARTVGIIEVLIDKTGSWGDCARFENAGLPMCSKQPKCLICVISRVIRNGGMSIVPGHRLK